MLYKHLFSILCGHLNLNKKKKKKLNLTGYQSNRPVTSQTGRYTGLTGRYTGTNRLNWEVWIQIWICPIPTGNRPNRTGIPEPEAGGYRSPVGYVNPGCSWSRRCGHSHVGTWRLKSKSSKCCLLPQSHKKCNSEFEKKILQRVQF